MLGLGKSKWNFLKKKINKRSFAYEGVDTSGFKDNIK